VLLLNAPRAVERHESSPATDAFRHGEVTGKLSACRTVNTVTPGSAMCVWHENCAQTHANAAEKTLMNQRTNPAAAPRRLRAAALGASGGASSMIRLSRAGAAQLPTAAAMSLWASRAAASLRQPR